MKIAIIGPVFPYRGGIAHHTGSLAYSLGENGINVETFSFLRQYPSFLYPGKSQKEIGKNPFPDLKNHFSLDTLNPFSWWCTYKAIVSGEFSICIFKYWHFYFMPCFTFLAFLLKKKGIKIICIIDNLFTHEGHFLDRISAKIFFSYVDISVTQSSIVDMQFKYFFPKKNHIMLQHPLYAHFGEKISSHEARTELRLPLDKKILLFFGFIRPYKGLDDLLNIFPEIVNLYPNIHLLVAGECFGSFRKYQHIIDKYNLGEHITLHIKYIPNENVRVYFSAADVFVMPYKSATNSGVMEIANYYDLPILASNIQAFWPYKSNRIELVEVSNAQEIALKIHHLLKQKNSTQENHWSNFVTQLKKFF